MNTYKWNNTRVAIQQQYACIVMDNGPLRTKICVVIQKKIEYKRCIEFNDYSLKIL